MLPMSTEINLVTASHALHRHACHQMPGQALETCALLYMPARVRSSGGKLLCHEVDIKTTMDKLHANQECPHIWVHAPGGPFAAAVVSFNVTADRKGSIALTWTAAVDQAIVGGLELYHAGGGPQPKTPEDVFESVVAPAVAPSYGPHDFSTLQLQAAAPGPLLSAGKVHLFSGVRFCCSACIAETRVY